MLPAPLALFALLLAEPAASAPPALQAEPPPPPPAARPAAPPRSILIPSLHAGGVLVAMDLGAWALWPGVYDPLTWDRNLRQLRRSYSTPPDFRSQRPLLESDGDPWTINVFGHGLFGSEIWQRARGCELGVGGAALLTAGTTLAWEYGFEALHKQPSAIDLVLTPTLGAALGEARHRLRRWAAARPGVWRRVLVIVADPFGETERALGSRC